MKKPQYVTLIVAAFALILLWAFAKTVPSSGNVASLQMPANDPRAIDGQSDEKESDILPSFFSIDSVLKASKMNMPNAGRLYVDELEASVANSSDKEQKLNSYHQLSRFWKDSAKVFAPYAWYVAEGARLENSEKNLNFAGHLFLSNLQHVEDAEMRRWMALQAKDLLERSLKINPDNDSAKVGIGSTYIFGGISNAPMGGIAKVREVAARDSTNIYAQMTLAMGSLMSGQTEKALERLETTARIDPKNIQAILLMADLYERQDRNADAIKWYKKALPLVSEHAEMKAELEKRIGTLEKQKS